jgi:hypothetical protein
MLQRLFVLRASHRRESGSKTAFESGDAVRGIDENWQPAKGCVALRIGEWRIFDSLRKGIGTCLTNPNENKTMHPLLLSALIQIESGGNDQARGRHGELGALQIKPILVRDVNRISDESLARIWQGGPKGLRKSSTRAYGRRVMRELHRQQDISLAGTNETRR